jgi:hypothetical protein
VKIFNNFIVSVSSKVNIKAYNTVIIWCEPFGQFMQQHVTGRAYYLGKGGKSIEASFPFVTIYDSF